MYVNCVEDCGVVHNATTCGVSQVTVTKYDIKSKGFRGRCICIEIYQIKKCENLNLVDLDGTEKSTVTPLSKLTHQYIRQIY